MREIERINRQYFRIPTQAEKETGEARYCKRILQKNDVKGLLLLNRRYIDGESFYYYAIEGLHSMEEVFEGAYFSREDMECFVECLSELLEGIKDFLLKQDQLYLHPAYIMYDGVQQKWKFLYLIDSYQEQGQDMVELMDFFLSKMRSDVEKESWFYEYYTDILQFGNNISPSEFVRMWRKDNGSLTAESEEIENEVATREQQIRQPQRIEPFVEPVKADWKEKCNRLRYARLYLVPFQPDH